MNRKHLSSLLFVSMLLFSYWACKREETKQIKEQLHSQSEIKVDTIAQPEVIKESFLQTLRIKADSALNYSKVHNLNTNYAILFNAGMHSGKKRFFVWDYKKDSIKYSSLCCHGKGQNQNPDEPEFSNKIGSHCSALGHYKMGYRVPSNWGIKYRYNMYGLDSTNNNAFKRIIALHSHDSVPNTDIYPEHIRFSKGCPAISDSMMLVVDSFLQKQYKPLLLWIYQ